MYCLICCVWLILRKYTLNYIRPSTTKCHKEPVLKHCALHISMWHIPYHSCCPSVICARHTIVMCVCLCLRSAATCDEISSSAMLRLIDRSIHRNFGSCLPVDTMWLPITFECSSTRHDSLTFRMLCVCYSIRTSWNEMATSFTSCYRGGNATKTEQSWASKHWPGVSSTWLR